MRFWICAVEYIEKQRANAARLVSWQELPKFQPSLNRRLTMTEQINFQNILEPLRASADPWHLCASLLFNQAETCSKIRDSIFK